MEDLYRTLKEPSQGNYKEKGSKFPTFAYPVYSEEEIKGILDQLRKDYYDARHHCYAWRLGADKERYRANDDGEPSSSAGKPILGQIQSHDLTNILIVVIRYFGGTKLGVSGLINAYRTAAADAISNGDIIVKTVNDIYCIKFSYAAMNDVMKILKDENPEQFDQKFDLNCELKISVRQSETEKLIEKFEKIDSVECEFVETV